jgi:hypothetical protein
MTKERLHTLERVTRQMLDQLIMHAKIKLLCTTEPESRIPEKGWPVVRKPIVRDKESHANNYDNGRPTS